MFGTIAVMTRQEIVLFIMGGLFVAEAVSVMLQVGFLYKLRKNASSHGALHHHFEEGGWKETLVVTRFLDYYHCLGYFGADDVKLR